MYQRQRNPLYMATTLILREILMQVLSTKLTAMHPLHVAPRKHDCLNTTAWNDWHFRQNIKTNSTILVLSVEVDEESVWQWVIAGKSQSCGKNVWCWESGTKDYNSEFCLDSTSSNVPTRHQWYDEREGLFTVDKKLLYAHCLSSVVYFKLWHIWQNIKKLNKFLDCDLNWTCEIQKNS